MAISKEGKGIIRDYIKILKDRRKEVVVHLEEVKKEEENIINRKKQVQSQINDIDAMIDKMNSDIADWGISG